MRTPPDVVSTTGASLGGAIPTRAVPVGAAHWSTMTAGTRVVVRRLLENPAPDGPHLTDLLGVVARVGAESVTIDTSHGPVGVPGAAIVLWKPVPPAPERRTRRR